MTLAQRISDLMDEKNLSQSELARRVGVTQQTIGKLTRGESQNSVHLHRIARELETTVEYLTGDTDQAGLMKVRQVEVFQGASQTGMRDNRPEMVEIAKIDLRYGLGGTYVDGPVETDLLPFPKAWIRMLTTAPPEMLVWAETDGDSMEPTIRSREPVLIDLSQRTPRMSDGIWAFTLGDIGGIKRLRPMTDGTVKILSDNPTVPPDVAADGELHVVGRVISVVRGL